MSTPKKDRAQVSATVEPQTKQRVADRAREEDRDVGRVVARAVEVYLHMSVEEADERVRAARDPRKGPKADG